MEKPIKTVIRIPAVLNHWLLKEAERTYMPKNSVILRLIAQARKEDKAIVEP